MKIKNFPHTLVIILFIMVGVCLLTWLIPAGEYERVPVNGRMVLVPGTYKEIGNQPQGIGSMLTAPIKGIISGAQIIGFVLLIGGAFGMINKTGAIASGLSGLLRLSIRKPRYKKFVIPLVMIFFSLAGATFGMGESVIVFVMITIPLAIALGYDSIVGICMSYLAAATGFAAAVTNPFNIGVAQGIAELPLFSGWEFRIIIWLVMTSIAIIFVMLYAGRIEKKPETSVVFAIDRQRESVDSGSAGQAAFTWKERVIVILLFVALGLLVIGANKWNWYINEISGLFLALALVSVFIARLSPKDAVDSFLSGVKDLVAAGLIIGFSRGLLVLATDGRIIDTILYSVSGWGKDLPNYISVQLIFLFQSCFTFLVPSGSGQAALTVPIVAPLSDLLGVGRQTAIIAFHLGDGLMSMIVPTSGMTMGVLAIANIPYPVWVKWFYKLLLVFMLASAVALVFSLSWFGGN